ncbi:hypothetical protein KP509_30G028900 [Ceratopteris richardii]|uniref:Secreted protein n=1 Tax=Ceratopteris richardii TaxID=49495 RepID=A0A8T2R2J7_CERRI|nr:hypothetical protein KP509_30G028900 [Ceratopteris richardii]
MRAVIRSMLFLIGACILCGYCRVSVARSSSVAKGIQPEMSMRGHYSLSDIGYMKELKCQHCPCLYGADDVKCHLCYECDEGAMLSVIYADAKSKKTDQSETPWSPTDESKRPETSASSSSLPLKTERDGLGAPCCSKNTCCYFQF